MSLTIGVDATCWANPRGYGRFTRELCTALVSVAKENRFVFFADQRAADAFELEGDNVRLIVVDQSASPTEAASSDGSRSPFDMLRLTRAVRREKLDVFFSPSVYTYFPLPLRLRTVVTIHDAIAERFPNLTLPSPRARLFWKAKVKLAVAQARLVLTVSEFSKRDLTRVLRIPEHRIRVTVEAPAPAYGPAPEAEVRAAAERIGLPPGAPWLMYVGGFNPHKHVDVIVRAHAQVRARTRQDVHLVLVGPSDTDVFHGDQIRIRREIGLVRTENCVHWPGFLPDEELARLHTGAACLLLPSACEGFGLPAVEAAACGTPVVATTESPLPELLAGGGHFVAPGEETILARAIEGLVNDDAERARLGAVARERAQALTWPRGAELALAALKEAAS